MVFDPYRGTNNSFSIGMGQTVRSSSFEFETLNLIGAMSVQPSTSQANVINSIIRNLKSYGLWNDLELFYVLASHDEQAARLNWISRTNDLSLISSPIFTANQGYAGNGTSAALRLSPWTPTIVTQNSATFGVYTRTASSYDGATTQYTLYAGSVFMLRRPIVSGDYQWRMHDGTSANTTVASQTGHHAVRRTASNERSIWENGAQLATNAQASTSVSNQISLFYNGSGGWGDGQLSIVYAARAFTNQQMIDMNTVINTSRTLIGF